MEPASSEKIDFSPQKKSLAAEQGFWRGEEAALQLWVSITGLSPHPYPPICVSSLLFKYDKCTFDTHYNTDTVF